MKIPNTQSDRTVTATETNTARLPSAEPSAQPRDTAADSILAGFGPGTAIRHYELVRELGRGGMAQVYVARDTKLGRLVAIKFVMRRSDDFTRRFLREARTTARCQHENIVTIHSVDTHAGWPYIVLEFLRGESLATIVKGRAIPPQRCVELITPVARALAHAHDFGIIHRDLKPENIFVTDRGVVKVLDFGIAKIFDSTDDVELSMSSGHEISSSETVLTNHGAFVGTPPYMAPEQWGGGDIDVRADIWAVGIAMWEMVAGRRPIQASSLAEYRALATAASPLPPIGDAQPDVPQPIARIIDRCLARDRNARFANAAALLDALTECGPWSLRAKIAADEPPYPGLFAFREDEAHLFFGRRSDIRQVAKQIRSRPFVCISGPSGAGKSSFVLAGIAPALKNSGERWQSIVVRPGRRPLEALAVAVAPLVSSLTDPPYGEDGLVTRFVQEPGSLGALLRAYSRSVDTSVLLFIDQLEELYTIVDDPAERRAFTRLIAAAADDPAGPIRVVATFRSDFLDRIADDHDFLERVAEGLWFLGSLGRDGLREALTAPAHLMGYQFEESVIEHMLDSLDGVSGSLPLLQFTAARLWEARDRALCANVS